MKRVEEPSQTRDEQAGLAAFYALYLREIERLAPDEAAYQVKQRYPRVVVPNVQRAEESR